MGIKDLNKFLKEKSPEAFRRLNVNLFRGKRIAIDATLWVYSSLSSTLSSIIVNEMSNDDLLDLNYFKGAKNEKKQQAINNVLSRSTYFVSDFYALGITPVFVVDGDSPPEKTTGARVKRKARKDSILKKIELLRKNIEETDLLLRRQVDFDELRKLLKGIPPVNPGTDFGQIWDHLENSLGAVVITAPDEAEKFCAFLSIKGVTAASYTTDTDSYPFGAPIVLNGFSTPSVYKKVQQERREHQICGTSVPVVMEEGEKEQLPPVTFSEFEQNIFNAYVEERDPLTGEVFLVPSSTDEKIMNSPVMKKYDTFPINCKPVIKRKSIPGKNASTLSINEITNVSPGTHFNAVVVPIIRKKLNLTPYQLVDLCIMFGCDFNDRVKDFGPARIWKEFDSCRKSNPGARRLIEDVIATAPKSATRDWDVLKQERCREIFLDYETCEEYLKKYLNVLDVSFDKIEEPRAIKNSSFLPRGGARNVMLSKSG